MFTWVMIFLYFPPAGPGRALGSTQGLLHLSTGWGGREEGGRRGEGGGKRNIKPFVVPTLQTKTVTSSSE